MIDRIKALIIKELIAIWQDPKSRFMLVALPFVQLFVFTFAATLDVRNISIGILNRDEGAHSFELIERIEGSPLFEKILFCQSEAELRQAIDRQEVLIALHFDEHFSREVHLGKSAQVQIVVDGRKSNSGQIAQGYIARIINQYNQERERLPGVEIFFRNWFNPNLIYPWFTLTGLVAILTMFTSLSVTALSVARERELHTFDQLLVTPLSPLEIILGKSIPGIFLGMVEGTLLLLAGVLLIKLPIVGSLIYLYLGMFVFILAIVGIGLFISSLSRTQQQANLGVFLFMSPSIILSGYATRIANMPDWLQWIAAFNPLKYFILIIRGVTMKDSSFTSVIDNVIPMMLIGLFTLTTSSYFFRSKMRSI